MTKEPYYYAASGELTCGSIAAMRVVEARSELTPVHFSYSRLTKHNHANPAPCATEPRFALAG